METVELSPEDAAELTSLYAGYEWWADREEAEVYKALEHTPLALGLRDDGELVAAARVITDFVYYAKIYDVLVAEAYRGEGIGSDLLDAVLDHPDLTTPHLVVTCREGLVEFYESVGFEPYPETIAHPGGPEEPLHHLVRQPTE